MKNGNHENLGKHQTSVLQLAVISLWCEKTSWCSRQQSATPVACIAWCLQITGHDPASDLLCLTETWHKADSAVLGHLCGAAYNVVDSARPRSADDLLPSVNHSSIAIGADIALSPIDIADPPTMFEIVCARAGVGCFAAIVVLLYWQGFQPLQPQQTFLDEPAPVVGAH